MSRTARNTLPCDRSCAGSGDIALAFTTAYPIDHDEPADLVPLAALNESRIDPVFRAVTEATQEAVLNAMIAAPATTGRDGHHRLSLADWLREAVRA